MSDVDNSAKESIIREKYQVTLPTFIRNSANLKIGDTLLWEYDEKSNTITAIPKPKSFTAALSGLGKHMWKDGAEQLRKERVEEWDR